MAAAKRPKMEAGGPQRESVTREGRGYKAGDASDREDGKEAEGAEEFFYYRTKLAHPHHVEEDVQQAAV